MRWIKLDGKKEPVFKELVTIWYDSKLGIYQWVAARLNTKTQTSEGIKYEFISELTKEKIENATHYLEIEPPKEKDQ